VEMHNTSRCAEIEQRYPWLISTIVNAHNIQLAGEAKAAKKSAKKTSRRPVSTV